MSGYQTEASLFSQSEWKSNQGVRQARLCQETGLVIIDWDSGDDAVKQNAKRMKMTGTVTTVTRTRKSLSTSYPYVWLRDFCHCEQCFDEASVTKKTNLLDLDFQTTITQISVDDNGKQIRIRWSDDHQSVYPSFWLWCNRFHDTAPDPFIDLPPEFWSADGIRDRLREFQFDELMTSDEVLYEWMREIKVLGLTLIKDAPQNKEALSQLGKRIGYLKDTNFGQVSSVYAPTNPKNPIYTAGNLFFHTDLTYYQQQPGIELLHCIKQFEGMGGDSTLVDGFSVARQLREIDPQAFKALSSQYVEFYQTGLMGPGKYFQLARNKIIRYRVMTISPISITPALAYSSHDKALENSRNFFLPGTHLPHLGGVWESLDGNGEPSQISFSNHSRTSVLRMPPEIIANFYKAMKLLTGLMYDQKNMYTYKMVAGDVIVINNFRVLHGRKGFEMQKGSERHLATAYLDWDLVYSRLRVLHNQLDI